MKKEYLSLDKLEVYQLARELSRAAWEIYRALDWRDKKILGDQFIGSVDSVGANIAEGFGRYHFLDKVKFYFNARGSLLEAKHWLSLLSERKKIDLKIKKKFLGNFKNLRLALNGLISSTMKVKKELKK
jgi:four helix bundle protein